MPEWDNMRKYILGFLMLAGSQAAAEQCVQVVEKGMDRPDPDDPVPELVWRVVLENRCDDSYDADLTIRFIDEDGQSLYEVRHLEIVSRREQVEVEREAYVPDRYAKATTAIEVDVEERERPY